MEKFLYYIELFNIYKCLFTEKKQDILDLYFNENLSLSEISNLKNVSKSYVGKIISESEKKLDYYENNIGYYKLLKKSQK